jgi:hypothetical protein
MRQMAHDSYSRLVVLGLGSPGFPCGTVGCCTPHSWRQVRKAMHGFPTTFPYKEAVFPGCPNVDALLDMDVLGYGIILQDDMTHRLRRAFSAAVRR